MSGIEKHIDNLGRVVIPKKFRQKLGLETNSRVTVSLDDDVISITSTERRCALCGGVVDASATVRLCGDCIEMVKNCKEDDSLY